MTGQQNYVRIKRRGKKERRKKGKGRKEEGLASIHHVYSYLLEQSFLTRTG
jgi:hypothetical protein